MARITVEDCALVVENRFELVAVAAKRTKDIFSGSPILIERDKDKNPVVALREIAARKVDVETLKDQLIQHNQMRLKKDLIESDDDDMQGGHISYADENVLEDLEDFAEDDTLFQDENDFIIEGDDSDN